MSYCRREGKDMISFVTKEDHSVPSSVTLPEPEPSPGLILPDGSINWNCPCLGGMATGPCGVEFREAFSCFHYSMEEKKGSNCYEEFNKMQSCMQKFPSLYNVGGDDDDGDFGLSEADNSLLEGKKPDTTSDQMKNIDKKSSDLPEKNEVKGEKHSL